MSAAISTDTGSTSGSPRLIEAVFETAARDGAWIAC
jgi:hypothetical protein